MRDGWKKLKLGDVCTLQNGFAFKSKLFKSQGMPVLRISSIQDEQVCDNRPVFTDPADYNEDLSKYLVRNGDLLIAMSGATTGKIGFNRTGETFLLNQRVGKFEPSSKLNINYLFYFLSTQVEKNLEISAGAAQPNLSTSQINEFKIPLPPPSEQKRIGAILDEAFEGIDRAITNAKKNLVNARELFESYLNKVFTEKGEGWVEKKLSEVCEKITDGTHQTPKYFDKGYIFLSSKNVTSGEIDWNNIKYIDENQHIAMQNRLAPRLNDILLAKNGTTGVAAMVDRDIVFDIYVSLALLRSKGNILPTYLLHFINSPIAKKQFNKRLKGVGVPNLHLKEIREVVIPYPESMRNQELIVAKLDDRQTQSKKLISIYQQKLAALSELKQSLLQKAFSGELTTDVSTNKEGVAFVQVDEKTYLPDRRWRRDESQKGYQKCQLCESG
jgi:type I restriction enzyme, S subunit